MTMSARRRFWAVCLLVGVNALLGVANARADNIRTICDAWQGSQGCIEVCYGSCYLCSCVGEDCPQCPE